MSISILVAAALALPGGVPLSIEGDGKSGEVRRVLPDPATLVPDGVYGFSYMARSDRPAHCLAGTDFAALGTGEPGDGVWRRRTSVFVAPSRREAFPCRFHFGQWRPNGRIEVKDVEVTLLRADHLSANGIELGGGERIDGNGYLYSFPFGRDGRNAARPLFRFDCPINGRLWWFKEGAYVTYRHAVAGRRFSRAKVFAGSSSWSGGEGAVGVEVSADGERWLPLGEVRSRTAVDMELPSAMFPCEEVYVRFTGGAGCTVQVAHYNIKGTVDGAPVRMAGATRFVERNGGALFAEVGPSVFDDDSYGALVARGKGVRLWTAGSGRKVSRTRPAPGARAAGLAMRTAANEAESVQLIVRAESALADVKVSVRGDLACAETGGRIPAAAVDVKRVGYVDVRHPTDFAGLPIAVPDKLLPMEDGALAVGAGENQPFWVTVRTPKGAGKGMYRGIVDVAVARRGGGTSRFAVPLSVEVFGFALPDAMTCQTAFGLTASLVAKAHRLEERSPGHRDVMERYLRAMAENHISPYRPAFFDGWHVTWNGDRPTFDFGDWDREMDRVLAKYHFNTFSVWLPGLGQCSYDSRTDPVFMGLKPDDPRYEKRLGAYVAAVNRHIREKGWPAMPYVYPYDEPRREDFGLVRDGFALLAKYGPDLRRMLPSLSHETFRELDGAVNLWCPQIQFLASPNLKAARDRGDRIWWYVCNNPKAPYVCDFIDHAAPELRIWLWQTWKERVAGVLIWDAFNWRGQTKHPDQNGEGRFLYPPEECARTDGPVVADPVQSVRIAHLRDGLEDYEYFSILKRLDPANALLRVPDGVTSSMTDFSADPAAMEKHRLALARAIEAIADAGLEMDAVYTVPHELDCLIRSGHIQGACCSEKAVYLSHARGLEKIGWDGRLIKRIDAPPHLGDTAFSRGRVYGAFVIRDRAQRKDGKCGLVRVWDEDLNQLDEAWFDDMLDGITVMGDTIYVGVDRWGYPPHSECAVKRLGLDLSDRGTVDIPLPHPINYGVQTMCNDGRNLFFGLYGAPADKGNPKRLNCARLSPDLKLLDSLRFDFGCAEGFDLVPRSVAKRDSVYFAVRAMGGNMQGWRKDPVNNPPRIRLEFYRYGNGAFRFITKKPIRN